MKELFNDACAFRTIKITDAVNTIAASAFELCNALSVLDVELSNSTRTLDIGDSAFNTPNSCTDPHFRNISIGRRNVKVKGNSFNFKCMAKLEELRFSRNISVEGVNIPSGELLMKELVCNENGCGCEAGLGSSLTDNTKYFGNCQKCGVGRYSSLSDDREVCRACPKDTYSSTIGATECQKCENLVPGSGGSNVCGDKCKPGTHVSNGGQACSYCVPGKYSDQEGMEACEDCPTGRYSTTEGGNSKASCMLCDAGSYAPSTGLTKCEDCPVGTDSTAAGCSECTSCQPAHYGGSTGLSACLPCPAGKYVQASGQTGCDDCKDDLTTIPGKGRIDDDCFFRCAVGEAAFNSKTGCQKCPAGTYNNMTGHNECTQCPLGTFSGGQGAALCSLCPAGSFADVTGSPTCTLCAAGKFGETQGSKTESDCGLCDVGYYSFPGSTSCREAPPGSFINTTGAHDATECPAGRYQDKRHQTACILAPAGRYAEKGAAVAILCDEGTYSDRNGTKSKTACVGCPRGKSSTIARTSCDLCAKGTYSSVQGAPSCLPCKAGKAMNDTGAIECLDCEPGTFTAETGRAVCLICGIHSIQKSSGSQKCDLCGKGLTADPGHVKCVEDTAGSKCKVGFGISDVTGKCVACEPGSYSPSGIECSLCKPAYYSDKEASSECIACPAGRFGTTEGNTNETACTKCTVGRYVNIVGATECFECPPGSFCGDSGMKNSKECVPGTFTDTKMSKRCIDCPSGRYQNSTGAAKCSFCSPGTYYDGVKATNADLCLPCKPGTYGATAGLAECSRCATGQVQPASGAQKCNDCSLEGKIKTNNAAYTECIDNQALLSTSVVEAMFTKGIALGLAFATAGIFACLAGVMHFLKTKHTAGELSSLGVHQVVLKSALPGFSFGSEVFLIIGMWADSPKVAATMLAFRLLHPVAMILLSMVLFFPSVAPQQLRHIIDKSTGLHRRFVSRSIPIVGMLLLSCLGDITMMQMLPWKASAFYDDSQGFPSYRMMKFALGVKTLQSVASVICQLIYLGSNNSANDPTATKEAKALFGLSITISMVSLFMGVLILFLKGKYLRKAGEEGASASGSVSGSVSSSSSSGGGGDGAEAVEMADLYGGGPKEDIESSGTIQANNPMHSPEMVNSLRRESEVQQDELKQKDLEILAMEVELEAKEEEIKKLRGQLGKSEELDTAESRTL